jgi:hypothetical protein
MRPIRKIIVHCSDSGFGDAAIIRKWHTDPPPAGRGWKDIGYHIVILNGVRKSGNAYDESKDGYIDTGRPLAEIGAHCEGHNADSIGICCIGVDKFTEKQMDALYRQIGGLVHAFGLQVKDIFGHYEMDTAHGKTCPNMKMNDVRAILTSKLAAGSV